MRLSSDWHLGHKNILKYDKDRGSKFQDIEDMDKYIIGYISAKEFFSSCLEGVEDGILIFCWDLALWNINQANLLLDKLAHIPKYWVFWNHDGKNAKNKLSHHFIDTCDTLILNGKIHINHFPPIDYKQNIKYQIDTYDHYIHWHTHKPWKKHYWYDISYNWWQLLYNLKDITWRL